MTWFAHVVILLICLLVLALLSTKWTDDLRGVIGNVLAAALMFGIGAILQNWDRLIFSLYAKLVLRGEPVRVSISHLIRVKIDGKMLLVRGNRITTQFQPVGGVYKYFPSAVAMMQALEVRDDDKVPIDGTSRHDLRVRVPGRHLPAFRRWFESGHGREIGPWREFYEELVEPQIVRREDFPHARFEFLRRHVEPISHSVHLDCKEWLVADVFDLCATQEQEIALRNVLNISHQDVLWADDQMIRTRGVVPPGRLTADISRTAAWLL